jgi:hypothetical protein
VSCFRELQIHSICNLNHTIIIPPPTSAHMHDPTRHYDFHICGTIPTTTSFRKILSGILCLKDRLMIRLESVQMTSFFSRDFLVFEREVPLPPHISNLSPFRRASLCLGVILCPFRAFLLDESQMLIRTCTKVWRSEGPRDPLSFFTSTHKNIIQTIGS